MRNKVIVSVVLITILVLLVVFVWPFIMGAAMKSQVYNWTKKGALPANATLTINQYHLGWLHSSMDLNLELKSGSPLAQAFGVSKTQKMLPEDYTFLIHLKASHGPLAHLADGFHGQHYFWSRGAATGTVQLTKPAPADFIDFPILKQPMQLRVISSWGGVTHLYAMREAGLIYANKQKKLMVSHGEADTEALISRDFKHWQGSFKLQNIAAKNSFGDFHVSSINGGFDIHRGLDNLWYGHESVNVPLVSFVKAGQNLAQLQNISYQANAELDKSNHMLVTLGLDLNHAVIQGEDVGPFKFNLSVSQLQPQALAAVQDTINQLAAEKPIDFPAGANKMQRETLVTKRFNASWSTLQPKIVSALPGVKIQLNALQLKTASGSASLTGQLQFPVQIPGAVTDPSALKSIFMAATGSATWTINSTLAKQLLASVASPEQPDPLADLVKRGYVKKQADNSLSEFDYEKGILTVNGKTIYPVPPKPKAKKALPVKPVVKKATIKPAKKVEPAPRVMDQAFQGNFVGSVS